MRILSVAFVVCVAGCAERLSQPATEATKESTTTEAPKVSTPVPEVFEDSKELFTCPKMMGDRYKANPIEADSTYKNKKVWFSGWLQEIDTDASGRAFLVVTEIPVRPANGIRSNQNLVQVTCFFDDSERESLLTLRQGEIVSLTGIGGGRVSGQITLKHCVLNRNK